jgi:16S rRNA (guanine527-N7)-methyltransferase
MSGGAELGIELSSAAVRQFELYSDFLAERGAVMDLTAIKGGEDTARLHFLDSLSVSRAAELVDKRVLDVGSGAGFPGLALKIAFPSLELTLLDAREKRVDFLSELCERLGLAGVECLHARAEETGHTPDMREGYDVVLSRAVAQLRILCELCLPYVKLGGKFIAMKSTDTGEETASAENAIAVLGGELTESIDYRIPGTEITHRLLIIVKKEQTPTEYPRRFAKIQKKPL